MIIATAGHIDHGKTALVKRLTGVDTDRLPEEKARGISIDLGFAYLPLPDSQLIGFVDVPGHERFIRNMVAGVTGIDFALLVVAADDGVMPQTVEHLNILDLLGVTRGVAVVSKIDRVTGERVCQVVEAVASLLSATRLTGAPIIPVSTVTGEGIQSLRELIAREAAVQTLRRAEGQHFRLAVDRAFTVAGSGTVVTGTVFSGAVAPGDRLVISPAGTQVRVRALQISGQQAERAQAGQRCALNLTGADLESVRRGDWVLAPMLHQPTQRIDARVTVLAGETHPLRHWSPVHLHLATADVTARVAIRRGAEIAPGASDLVQLILDKPIGALHGDRFILRDQSASRTVGGGTVVDPFPPARRRRGIERLAELAALDQPDPRSALAALARVSPGGIDLERFERTFNLTAERALEIYAAADIVSVGRESRVGLPRTLRAELCEKIVADLTAFHRESPQALGKEIETLRADVAKELPASVFTSLLRELADERRVEVSGSIVRLPGHDATSNPEDERLWRKLRPVLEKGGFSPPPPRELAASLGLKEPVVRDFLHRKARSGEVMKVTADRFYPRTTLATLAAIAQATAQAQPNGMFTAAQYRDATGIGRGLAIEILEFFDTLGITQRIGDGRKMRRDFVPILGAASAPEKPGKANAPAASAGKPPLRNRNPQHFRR